jgi:hypothetical protein
METKMSNRNWTLGGIAAVVLAAVGIASCDPYIQPVGGSPQILGVVVSDVNFAGAVPSDIPGCVAPYPEVNVTWAQATYPGTCLDTAGPSMCPVPCFPPRMGPLFAPYFTGNLGGSYQCTTTATNPRCAVDGSNGTYVFGMPAAWILRNVPAAAMADGSQFSQIRVVFNKMLLPSSVQANPGTSTTCTAAAGLSVTVNGAVSTGTFDVCYWPNSFVTDAGASLTVTPKADATGAIPELLAGATYVVAGSVSDQDGNSLPITVTVITAP